MNKKTLAITFIVFLSLVLSSIFSYKMGLRDSGTYVQFSEAGMTSNYQKLLIEKGDKKLLEFMETMTNSSIRLHRLTLEEGQSIFSAYIGPLKEIRNNKEHYLNYYNHFKNRAKVASIERPDQVQKDIQWLFQNIQVE